MMTTVLIICLLPWLVILLYQISSRRFRVLLVWLLIAPIVTNFAEGMGSITLHRTVGKRTGDYVSDAAKVTLYKLLKPTRIVFAILVLFFLGEALLKKRRTVPFDRAERWMAIFSVMLLVSVFLKSWRLGYGLTVAIDGFIVAFLAYYLARRLVTSEDRFRFLTAVIGYMGVYVIVISLHEALFSRSYVYIDKWTKEVFFHRVAGPFENRDLLYVVMIVVFFAVLSEVFCSRGSPNARRVLPRSIAWFVILLAPVVIFHTYTRGNWIAFIMGLGILMLLGRRLLNYSSKVGAIGLALVLIPVIVVGVQFFSSKNFVEGRVANMPNVYGRFATWEIAIGEAEKAPILGIGLNNLEISLSQQKTKFAGFENYSSPHNTLLAIFVELGTVGLLVHLAITAALFQIGVRLYRRGACFQDRWRGITVIAIMVAYYVPSLFTLLFHTASVAHIYVYAFLGSVAGLYGTEIAPSTDYSGATYDRSLQASGGGNLRIEEPIAHA